MSQMAVKRPATRRATAEAMPASRQASMGWPLVAGLIGYPIAWLLGLELVIWPAVAGLLLLGLLRNPRPLVGPRGIALWIAFLVWNIASLPLLTELDRVAAWAFRFSHYFGALIVIVAIASTSEEELPRRRIARAIVVMWSYVVIGGYLGILLPGVDFPSVGAVVLPEGVTSIQFIRDSVILSFGAEQGFAGGVRPSTLFAYTNDWAAVLGVLTPMAVYAQRYLSARWSRITFWVLAAASFVPMVLSVNRGLWVSLAVVVVVGTVLLALHGHVRAVLSIGAVVLVAMMALVLTPLWSAVQTRLFDAGARNLTTRESLVSAALETSARSPLLGYGAPVSDPYLANANDVSVGTHGQLWTLMVSTGFVAAGLYVLFFLAVLWATRGSGQRGVWLQVAVVVLLTQAFFYSATPMPITLGAISVGLLVREATSVQQQSVARHPIDLEAR